MAGIWRVHRLSAIVGIVACLLIVHASASSGPILSATWACVALAAWPLRRHMRFIRWSVVGLYALLELVMNAPAYYLLARIDMTGSSTSWHRAELINAAVSHLSEWWLVGTDVTLVVSESERRALLAEVPGAVQHSRSAGSNSR